MGRQIIKQPNGNYAVWFSIVDDFIFIDCTPEEIINEFVEYNREQITQDVERVIVSLEKGEKPYYQFTRTFKDAIKQIRSCHGGKAESLQWLREQKIIK